MNTLCVIFPYRMEGVWVFGDAAIGLVREPFQEEITSPSRKADGGPGASRRTAFIRAFR